MAVTYSLIVTCTYFSVYIAVFFIVSIVCAVKIKKEYKQQKSLPKQDETDYRVKFTESVLGLELFSDEYGFNCFAGRCVSTITQQNVIPGSQIVQVNDRWLGNYRFQEILDAIQYASISPPFAVTFRIKKNQLLRPIEKYQPQSQQNINIPNVATVSPQKCTKKQMMKMWAKSVWKKKSVYFQLIPHFFDQATDFGVIFEYWRLRNDKELGINTMYLFVISIFVIVLHRIVSSLAIYRLTKKK
eukprot:11172_1